LIFLQLLVTIFVNRKASPDGAIFSVSVADDPDEFCIDISAIVTADEFA
jgi:hypothetical protein